MVSERSEETAVEDADTRDVSAFNRWLCVTRLRAAGAVAVLAALLDWLHLGNIATGRVFMVCAALSLVTVVGLAWRRVMLPSRTFFTIQTLCDLTAITLGIAVAAQGPEALLFSFLFIVAIVPPSLISTPTGLTVATAAAACHGLLLAMQYGFVLATFARYDFLVPVVIFFLVAQQSFFYGTHLAQKNRVLRELATRLDEHREDLATEARISAALVEVAHTLGTTLDGPELLARVTRTTSNYMAADWSATFLLDDVQGSFHLVAASDPDASTGTLGCLDFPLASWPSLARLQRESIVTLTGEDARRVPVPLTGGQPLATVLLAGIRRDGVMAGVLAVGYRTAPSDGLEAAVRLLAGIVEQAAIVLQNARLLEEVRAASQLKSEFVGTISHELRSPMNVILGYAEMLLEGGLGPIASEQRDVLERTHRQALALLEMITALLDVNRLEAGRLPVQTGPVVVQELLAEIIEQLPDRWRSPQIAVRLEAAQELPPLQTDRGKLKTVVRNLVHNALKFTEHGSVTLAASQTPTDDLTIRVTDTGRGIPAEAIPYIFDMFRQVPGSGGGGVGLGLHIVHRFVDVLGGTVDVTSEVDVGTCFTVTLPRVAMPARAA